MGTQGMTRWLAVAGTAVLIGLAPTVHHTASATETAAGSGRPTPAGPLAAPSAAQVAFADACPQVAPPRVSCFARYRVGAATTLADGTPLGFGPVQLRSAYELPASGGADQVVAIVDAYSNPNAEADLATYRSQYGLPACQSATGCLRIVNQRGEAGPLPVADIGWGLEISLDLDMVSAACPDCRILLVEADSSGLDDMGAAVETAVRLGAHAISNSYGTSVEFAGEVTFEHYYHHPGHAIVASAGDLGYSVSFPAVSRYVTAVGGTSLTRSASGEWAESVWSGTGSGCSAYIPKPAWQTDPHCPMRMVADVAAVADPATGVAVRDTFGKDGWLVAGGTSASAPLIAGIYGRTGTSSRVNDGSAPWVNRAAGHFRDVTTGTNVPSAFAATCGGDYLCTGVTGYDGPTGWGTPLGIGGLTVQ